MDIWYDETVGRLNRDERGELLGNFQADDKILVVYNSGEYELTSFDLTNRYEPNKIHFIQKYEEDQPIAAIHFDGAIGDYFIKRFLIETSTMDKTFGFISEEKGSKLILATADKDAQIEVTYTLKGSREHKKVEYDVDMLIDVKGWKAMGNKLSSHNVKRYNSFITKKLKK